MVVSLRCFLWNCHELPDGSVHALHSSSFDELVCLSSPLPKCLESGILGQIGSIGHAHETKVI